MQQCQGCSSARASCPGSMLTLLAPQRRWRAAPRGPLCHSVTVHLSRNACVCGWRPAAQVVGLPGCHRPHAPQRTPMHCNAQVVELPPPAAQAPSGVQLPLPQTQMHPNHSAPDPLHCRWCGSPRPRGPCSSPRLRHSPHAPQRTPVHPLLRTQVVEFPEAQGPLEFSYDEEWLAVLRATHHLLGLGRRPPPLPPSAPPVSEADLAEVRRRLEEGQAAAAGRGGGTSGTATPHPPPTFPIPPNFQPTAPAYSPGDPGLQRGHMPQRPVRNPQTLALLGLLGLPYNLDEGGAGAGGFPGGFPPPPAAGFFRQQGAPPSGGRAAGQQAAGFRQQQAVGLLQQQQQQQQAGGILLQQAGADPSEIALDEVPDPSGSTVEEVADPSEIALDDLREEYEEEGGAGSAQPQAQAQVPSGRGPAADAGCGGQPPPHPALTAAVAALGGPAPQ